MGFPTRFENLVSSGFDPSGLVFLGSDREDDVCGFRGITPSRLRREGWVWRTECSDSTGHCRLFVVPGVGQSGFNDVPVGLGPSSDGLMTTRWMTPGLASAVRMEAANWASQRHLKARSARADSLARLAFGNSRHRAFRPLSEMYRSVPDHGLRSWRRAPGIP